MDSITLTFNYENKSEKSLYKLWKLTNDLSYIQCTKISKTERLNNRSWRLLNQRILRSQCAANNNNSTSNKNHKQCMMKNDSVEILQLNDLFKENTIELRPKQSQFISSRPSLFSHSSNLSLHRGRRSSTQTTVDSNCSQTSHDSKNLLAQVYTDEAEENDNDDDDSNNDDSDSDSDLSDISDISEMSESEEGLEAVRSNHLIPHQDGTTRHQPPQTQTKAQPHFKNTCPDSSPKFTKGALDATISSEAQTSPNPSNLKQPQLEQQNSLFSSLSLKDQLNQPSVHDQPKISPSAGDNHYKEKKQEEEEEEKQEDDEGYSSTDISEDDEEVDEDSDEDEHENQHEHEHENKHKLENENKIGKLKVNVNPQSKSWEKNTKEDNESEWMSVSSSSVNSFVASGRSLKTQLSFHKVAPPAVALVSAGPSTSTASAVQPQQQQQPPRSTSSTETIPSLERKKQETTPTLEKPRSLLSGLFLNELGNSESKRLEEKPKLLRSSTTGVTTIDTENKRPSIIFNRKYPSLTDLPRFSLRSNSSVSTPTSLEPVDDHNAPMKKQSSIVGISDINVSKVPKVQSLTDEEHETLSTSLNKLSRSVSQNSLMSLLSKSSISFGRLYTSGKNKIRPDHRDHRDYDSTKRGNSLFGNKKTDTTKQEPPSASSEQLPKHSPSSLTSSSSIMIQSSKSSNTPPSQFGPIPKITTTDTDQYQGPDHQDPNHNLSHNHNLEKEIFKNQDFSKSLKESLIIDNKLGKVAMPDKMLIKNQARELPGIVGEDDIFDDYHSKGW